MANIPGAGLGPLCPNCNARPADTSTPYDEALVSEVRKVRITRWRSRLASRQVVAHGTARLCAQCAATYRRNVALRTHGRRLVNWTFAALVAAAILYYILISAIPSLTHGPQAIVPAVPFLASVLVFAIGAAQWVIGLLTRRPAIQFVYRLKRPES